MITLKRRTFLVKKVVEFCKEMGADDALTAVNPDQEPKLEFDVVRHPGVYFPPYFIEDENGQISLPVDVLQDMPGDRHHPSLPVAKNVFEVLGFFSAATPDQVYLCPANILYYAASKFNHPDFWKVELQIITEIVFIHECAHWLHYKLNAYDYGRGTKNYLESWAQLCTKRMCIDLGAKYCQVFERMLEGQSEEYRCFTEYQEMKLGRVLQFFLKPLPQDPLLKDLGDIGLENKLDITALTEFNETTESSISEVDSVLQDLNNLGIYHKFIQTFIDEGWYQENLSS
jgi:hypothetical protein